MKKEEIWFHTQNLRRFPAFTVVVVVVTFFVEILDDFHDFVSECVFSPKSTNQFGRTSFFDESDNFHWA